MRLRRSGLLLLILLLAPPPVHAGTISLVLATRILPGAETIRVELDLNNRGDEAALNVVPMVEFQGRVGEAPAIAALQPSLAQTIVFEVPLAGGTLPRGAWPLLVRLRYTDAAGYPFEAVHVDLARFGETGEPSRLQIDVPDVRVETETTIRASVDRGDVDGPIRFGFATPAGVVVTPRIFTLEPGADTTVALTIATTGATRTSRLPLVTIAEYDTADGHHTVTVVSGIDIGPSPGGSRAMVIAVLVAATLTAWGAIAVAARRRRR